MLSAGKQQMPSDAPPSSGPQRGSGFGKVLSSVEGLQQRLNDFSIDELSRAHGKAHTLMQRLDDLQHRLDALTKLKNAIAGAKTRLSELPEESFDLAGSDGLEHYSQLRAIVQIGKLIRMHRALQLSQASAALSSVDSEEASSDKDSFEQRHESILEAPSTRELDFSPGLEATGEFSQPGSSGATSESELAAVDQELLTTSASPIAAAAVSETVTAEEPAPSDPAANRVGSRSAQAAANDDSSAVKSIFDQRLLNDLIQTYGEFALARGEKKPADSATMIPPELPADARTPGDLIAVQTTAAEPAFVRAKTGTHIALPGPSEKGPELSAPRTAPSLKKQGEIDRQLKRIIKDYGEVDLYSPQKTMNLKMAAIAAVAVLGLVLGGFYLFKTPAPVVPAAVEAPLPAAVKEQTPGRR
jgi:hypothetical protein